MLPDTLELDLRMRPGARVRIVGEAPKLEGVAEAGEVILDWQSSRVPYLVKVTEGRWSLEHLQVGNRRPRQRQGISVGTGAELTLVDVRVRVASLSGAGLHAHDGGRLHLGGKIEINEDFHEAIPGPESFAGVHAEDHGVIRFTGRDGSSLSVGNGSLSASYYGVVRLGCESARITSWGGQSNNIAVNNSGRIDLHGTPTVLRPRQPTNSPIGLEHDGHVLAEGAEIIIEGVEDGSGIVLQKASTLYCQDIEFRGPEPRYTLIAYSGSSFAGSFRGKVHDVHATTGATIAIGGEAELLGPFQATRGGTLSLPDGRVLRGESR